MKNSIRTRLRSQSGNAMVEFAIASAMLIPLFIGTFQFGYAFYVYNLVSTQVRSGARYASMRTFRCGSSASIDTFKSKVRNVVRYGNPSGNGNVIEPGLADGQVSVSIKDVNGNDADATHTPSYVVVTSANYSVDAVMTTFNFNNKPSVRMPYLGQYAPAETE